LACGVLLAACRPTPEELVELPTVASFSTRTPIPPTVTVAPTRTPTLTLTPTVTPTRTLTVTPLPTFTPLPPLPTHTDVPAEVICNDVLQQQLQTILNTCQDTDTGTLCFGSRDLQITQHPTVENPIRFPTIGRRVGLNNLVRIETEPLSVEGETWGVAFARVESFARNSTFNQLEFTAMVVFGGVTIQNRVPPFAIQNAEREGLPVREQPPLLVPMTRFSLRTNTDTLCDFVPPGVLLQSVNGFTSDLVVNNVAFQMDGTALLLTRNNTLEVNMLEGVGELTALGSPQNIVAGARVTIELNADDEASSRPSPMAAYDPRVTRGLFGEANDLFDVLPREISLPPAFTGGELVLLNTLAGRWSIDTEFVQITGLLSEGSPVNDVVIRDAQQQCTWEITQRLGLETRISFDVTTSNNDESFIGLEAFFPGLVFPQVLIQVPGTERTYTGTATRADGATFEHTIIFNSPTDLDWRVQAAGIPGTTCTGGSLRGDGSREAEETSPALQPREFELWQLATAPADFYVPRELVLLDCPADTFEGPSTGGPLSLAREDATLFVQGSRDDLPIPGQLTLSPVNTERYEGDITEGERQFFHSVRFAEDDTLDWQIMVRSTTENCRLGAIQATGTRFSTDETDEG